MAYIDNLHYVNKFDRNLSSYLKWINVTRGSWINMFLPVKSDDYIHFWGTKLCVWNLCRTWIGLEFDIKEANHHLSWSNLYRLLSYLNPSQRPNPSLTQSGYLFYLQLYSRKGQKWEEEYIHQICTWECRKRYNHTRNWWISIFDFIHLKDL